MHVMYVYTCVHHFQPNLTERIELRLQCGQAADAVAAAPPAPRRRPHVRFCVQARGDAVRRAAHVRVRTL
jgi:hypothetical protein